MKTAWNALKNHCLAMALLASFLIMPMISLAQEAAQPDGTADFVALFVKDIQEFGGATAIAKVSMIVMLLVASMKVNLINKNLWDKLGDGQKALVAPALAALAGLVTLGLNHQLDLAHLMVWLTAGAGAVILHEALDRAKLIPGIGPTYVVVINLIESFLDQKKTQTPT